MKKEASMTSIEQLVQELDAAMEHNVWNNFYRLLLRLGVSLRGVCRAGQEHHDVEDIAKYLEKAGAGLMPSKEETLQAGLPEIDEQPDLDVVPDRFEVLCQFQNQKKKDSAPGDL